MVEYNRDESSCDGGVELSGVAMVSSNKQYFCNEIYISELGFCNLLARC